MADMDTVGVAVYETLAVNERDGVNDEETVIVEDADAVDDGLRVTVEVDVIDAVSVGDLVTVCDAVTVVDAVCDQVTLGVGDAFGICTSKVRSSFPQMNTAQNTPGMSQQPTSISQMYANDNVPTPSRTAE